MTIQVRLYEEGGTPTDSIIEDLELIDIPSVGDSICLEYGKNRDPVYQVLSRRFYVLCTEADTENKFDRIALEVKLI